MKTPCKLPRPIAAVLAGAIGLAATAQSVEPSKTERTVIDYLGERQPVVLRLWPDGSPRNRSRNGKAESATTTNQLRLANTEHPSLLVYPPPAGLANTGAAMIFCPGGGYGILAMSNPKEFIEWMNPLGVTVAMLKYHVPRSKDDPDHQWPLADAQRAMRVLRAQSKRFGLAADKIGIIGSSAGGHLAFNLCVNHDQPAYQAVDALDETSCRPAFGMLFYPAYLTGKGNLTATPALHVERIHKTRTPPMLVTINSDDGFIHGSLRAMIELKQAKVPGELHVWPTGGHGGVFSKYPLAEHARPGIRFLVRHGILPDAAIDRSDAWLNDTVGSLLRDTRTLVSTPAPKPSIPTGMPDEKLSAIDRDIQNRHGRPATVFQLWPGDGTRADDPLKSAEETLPERNVPVASNVTVPTMTFFPAEKPDGRSVLVFPGGGYSVLAHVHEGLEVCHWLNQQGINAFLVKYRTPRRKDLDKHDVALQDAHRAIRLVRSQAKRFGVRADAIGVLGFSAGGHLSALAVTPQARESYERIDAHDEVSPVADFGVLIYPAYTTTEAETVDPLLRLNEKPSRPLFIATALDDKWTQGQFFFLHERLKSKQRVEYHIYENGGHGKGISNGKDYSFGQWPRECARWLEDLKHASPRRARGK